MIRVPQKYFFPHMYENLNNTMFHNINKVIPAMVVLFISFVVIQIIRKIIFLEDTVTAEGKITEIRKYSMAGVRSVGNRILLYPVVEYKMNGQKITFESSVGTSITRLKVGDTVKVRYNPNNYEDVEIDSFFRNWYGDIILIGVNVFILIISCIVLGTIL